MSNNRYVCDHNHYNHNQLFHSFPLPILPPQQPPTDYDFHGHYHDYNHHHYARPRQ